MFLRLTCVTVLALMVLSAPALAGKPIYDPGDTPPRQDCNMQGSPFLCMDLDETWDVVPFDGYSAPCYENDDASTAQIALGFAFDLFGTQYNSVFINNNGNISFLEPYWQYDPEGFPLADFPMVAPFWADVDTRSFENGAGVVWMKQGPNYLAVTWDHVGYYETHTEKQNTFQVLISDGTYEPMGMGNNVCFCYGDMQWTTGDASDGVDGFGGYPATVGVNKGDGVDYFLIGRFDHPGNDYDGPGGNVDGVDYLDNQAFCFFVGGEFNQPPIAIDFPPGDSINVCVGEAMELTVGFIGPENDQTVHTDVDDGGLANFDYLSIDGNPSVVEMIFTPDAVQQGEHIIHFTATDDFDPPGVTERDLRIIVVGPSATETSTWGSVKSLYR